MPSPLAEVADGIWALEQPVKAPGLKLDHRMTVVRLTNGELWIHSPVAYTPRLATALQELGRVRHFIAPNRYHDLHWQEWFQHFPEAAFYSVPGLREEHPELPFQNVLAASARRPWELEVTKLFIQGMPKLNEFVFVHSATGTLIVADLLFNLDLRRQNPVARFLLRLNALSGGFGCSRFFRRLIADQGRFRASIAQLLELDFDRLIPGHGQIVELGAKAMVRRAFAWLHLDRS